MNDKFDKAFQILADRGVWENKQRLYYQARHDGLRRLNKPFPTAADLHFPMIDMMMSKWKPFWLAQAMANERLAQFIAMRHQLADDTEAAADYFDFELKQNTNFEEELEAAIDMMLLRGRGVLKAVVDPMDNNTIRFASCDPLFILMPQNANDFTSNGKPDADYWVEVERLSVPKYQRNKNYNQSDDVLRQIRGRKDFNFEQVIYDKQLREGITHSRRDEEILLWHHYEATASGWIVTTYSPQARELVIRPPYRVPYELNGKASCPFYSFTMEVKDKGWYSPRGVAELCLAFEAYATKLWNEKADYMTFGNRPLFTAQNDIPNTANLRFNPGEFIPGGISAVQMPQPALSFDQELAFTRQTSEQRLMMPDFGVSTGMGADGKPRTATENNRIAALNNIGVDHNGRIFRRRLSQLYRHVWGLMVQYQRPKLTYFVSQDLKELPQQALHNEYLVMPDGSPDSWDKSARFQRALQRFQLFKGAPNIDQDELVRDVLSADDSRLINKLLIPSDQKANSEVFQEAVEICTMMLGFPAPVMPGEDHAARIMTIAQFLHKQELMGAPIDALAIKRLKEHMLVHMQYLKQLQPDAARQVLAQVQQLEQQRPVPQVAAPPQPEEMPA